MATTTNYGWTTPDNTALVKDGASAIRTLGSSVDTSLKSLSPGTTAGDVDYYTSSTAKARLGIGTTGQVLTVAGGVPSWSTPTAGSLTLISTTTLATATTTLSSIPGIYKSLYMVVQNATQTAAGAFGWQINGATSNYTAQLSTNPTTGATFNGGTYMSSPANPATTPQTGSYIIEIPNYTSTSSYKFARFTGSYIGQAGGTNWVNMAGIAAYNSTSAITSFSFFTTGTAYTGGTVLLYGVN